MQNAHASEDYLRIKDWIVQESPECAVPDEENLDHVTAVLEQLSRDTELYPCAKLEVRVDTARSAKDVLDSVSFGDFVVSGYKDNCYPEIRRRMPV